MRHIDFDTLESLPAYEPIRRALRALDDSPRIADRPKRMKPWRRVRKPEE